MIFCMSQGTIDRPAKAIGTGRPYQTRFDLLRADRRVADPPRDRSVEAAET